MLGGEITLEKLISRTRFNTLGKKDGYSNEQAELVVQFEINDNGEKGKNIIQSSLKYHNHRHC